MSLVPRLQPLGVRCIQESATLSPSKYAPVFHSEAPSTYCFVSLALYELLVCFMCENFITLMVMLPLLILLYSFSFIFSDVE